jgi:hypothetical protein
MKVVKRSESGEFREMLLKEYFLNAYVIAVLKRVGEEAGRLGRVGDGQGKLVEARIPIR